MSGSLRGDGVAHRVHQVGLAQAHAAVDEQGVEVVAGVVGHRGGRGVGQVGARAHHEVVEGVVGIQVRPTRPGRTGAGRRGGDGAGRGLELIVQEGGRGVVVGQGPAGLLGVHVEGEGDVLAEVGRARLVQGLELVLAEPIPEEMIGAAHVEAAVAGGQGLQGGEPGVERLLAHVLADDGRGFPASGCRDWSRTDGPFPAGNPGAAPVVHRPSATVKPNKTNTLASTAGQRKKSYPQPVSAVDNFHLPCPGLSSSGRSYHAPRGPSRDFLAAFFGPIVTGAGIANWLRAALDGRGPAERVPPPERPAARRRRRPPGVARGDNPVSFLDTAPPGLTLCPLNQEPKRRDP